jgi:hypothetical protein
VKNRFQSLPFKCNLQRYNEVQVDDCFWTMEDKSSVLLNLSKKSDMEWWSCVVRGGGCTAVESS